MSNQEDDRLTWKSEEKTTKGCLIKLFALGMALVVFVPSCLWLGIWTAVRSDYEVSANKFGCTTTLVFLCAGNIFFCLAFLIYDLIVQKMVEGRYDFVESMGRLFDFVKKFNDPDANP